MNKLILFFILSIAILGCKAEDDESSTDTSSATYVSFSSINISGARGIGINESTASSSSSGMLRAASSTATNKLIALDSSNDHISVNFQDASGDALSYDINPTKIRSLNSKLLAVTLDMPSVDGASYASETYLINKSSGLARALSVIPAALTGDVKNARDIQSVADKIYYKSASGALKMVDTSSIDDMTTDTVVDSVEKFLIDESGDIMYTVGGVTKLKTKSTETTLSPHNDIYWKSGKYFVYSEDNWAKQMSVDSNGDITSDYYQSTDYLRWLQGGVSAPSFKVYMPPESCEKAELATETILMCVGEYNGADYSTIFKLRVNPTAIDMRIAPYNIWSLTATGWDDDYYYISGKDSSGTDQFYRVDPSSDAKIDMASAGTYKVTIIRQSGDNLLVAGVRNSDNTNVLLEMDQSGDVISIKENINLTELEVL